MHQPGVIWWHKYNAAREVLNCLACRFLEKGHRLLDIFAPLARQRTLSVLPTFQCTAECTHCGTLSSPREKTWLSLDVMLSAIEQAAHDGYDAVVFTGGEPTLAGKNLLTAIRHAVSFHLAVRIVTNAHWAVNEKAARQRVQDLVEAGLHEINFSTGDQHARFVPLERVIRAAHASVEAGLPVAIMIETVKERRITKATVENHPEFQRLRQDFPEAQLNLVESPWMPLSPSVQQEYPEGIAINRANLAMAKGCESILTTTTIEADGSIRACCGIGMRKIPELKLGTIHEQTLAEARETASNDLLKRWIHLEGPVRILAWAATHDPTIEWENRYAHQCQACHRIYTDPKVRTVIQEHHTEKLADLLFAEWLLFHDPAECSERREPGPDSPR